MLDEYGRNIEYLRMSVTENCNLRCMYCMSESECINNENLTYDEYIKILKVLTDLGIKKVKITGGEPLLRQDIDIFINRLLANKDITSLTITTNGVMADRYWHVLKKLSGINISIDSLKEDVYRKITRTGNLDKVLKNINMIIESGYKNLKLNTVLIKGVNDSEIADFAEIAMKYPVAVRFIELMPIGEAVNFRGVRREEILSELREAYGDYKWTDKKGNGPAQYVKFENFAGEIGFIDAVNHKFCSECNRIRMDAKGNIILCLHHRDSISSEDYLRGRIDDDAFREKIRREIFRKPEKNVFSERNMTKKMNKIGG